ncbi:MAG TPA: thioredoxin family protein [Ohtaekwangia sp.]|uniref:thioredoxin family protein n=1 Tax=Ohtaekwangia sp. TaxID=2066019 RepID=UPI002F942D9B
MKMLVACLLWLSVVPAEWLSNMDAAREIATRENKYILLNFSGSDWCAPCIKMKKEVFENAGFVSLADEKLVLVRADFPRSKKNQLSKEQVQLNEALAEKYNPSGKFPFTVLLDANGKVVRQWDGYTFESQDKFIAELTKTLSGQ